jgi:Ser/Thr protein kinase RdoA (MazF antagonist)
MLDILQHYGFASNNFRIEPLGNGLINSTWLINSEGNKFVFQKINTVVFATPQNIASNITLLNAYLQKHHPNYLFVAPIKTIEGKEMVKKENDFYRLFPFIENSHTIDVVQTPEQAFEAAKQFGLFTKILSKLDFHQLKTTLPNFHNLSLRLQQFNVALKNGNANRISESKELIAYLSSQKSILKKFETLKNSFQLRVTHHDTKISNVLFDDKNRGLCVIDLDTVMPGYFISDVGDMLRTYLCPVSEEESDFTKIEIRPSFYTAIVDGYLSEMKEELNATEKKCFLYAGKYMTYMQALRFLTDYLNDDVYYGCSYPTHNLVRAGNQATLLQKLILFSEN